MIFSKPLVLGLAALGIAAGLVWAGHSWGSGSTAAVYQEREATRQREAREALEAEMKRGQEFAAQAITEQLDQRDRYDQLEQTYAALQKATPLVVARRAPAAAVALPDAGGAAVAQAATVCEPRAAEVVPGDERTDLSGGGASVELRLSLAAVRMWNGALTGEDAPAGACGAAAPTAEAAAACAQDSGLTPADAWANHAINARACAEDRLNHQNLIDFLQRKDQ